MIRALTPLVAAAGLVGCGAESPVPDRPTWVDDVKPILQANCFHCHGAAADGIRAALKRDVFRWDIYDLGDPVYTMLGFGEVVDPQTKLKSFVSAKDGRHVDLLEIWISPDNEESARMPPVPALPLSARDQQVLKRWKETGMTLGARAANGKPVIGWLSAGKSFAVTDADGDQVMGKLVCNGTEVPISRSGSHELPAGVTAPCSAMIYDGFDLVSTDLK